ncbi:UPAR/Ly6 domain-containing protein qvr-like [Littorina saxatilis]|uniref:UPAR/Ly6 domain-containing protein qvr-like n=1 Tax=Littorina saxatilis TaxID=31220 RepID=UPI0038B55F2C
MAQRLVWLLPPSTLSGVVAVLMVVLGSTRADTTDFSNPIVCYTCRGPAVNSSCADPVEPRLNVHLVEKECNNGVCVKWAKYERGVLQIIRTCSAELNFHLTMIDGVCRTERNGNGYLCMCGTHLCNTARRLDGPGWLLAILLAAYSVIVQRRL